jgi:hypothetical protein
MKHLCRFRISRSKAANKSKCMGILLHISITNFSKITSLKFDLVNRFWLFTTLWVWHFFLHSPGRPRDSLGSGFMSGPATDLGNIYSKFHAGA